MIGWSLAIGLAILVLGALLLVGRIPRSSVEISAAALLLGLAGYAWQGNPGLGGAPRLSDEKPDVEFDEKLVEQRRGLADRYGQAAQWLTLSDGLARQGNTKEAANVLQSGLRGSPDDPSLWLGLGNALIGHADGAMTPSADYAFRRALQADPTGPAPRYFYGLALARDGQLREARAQWLPLVQSAPPDSKVRAELMANIARIDAMLSGNAATTP